MSVCLCVCPLAYQENHTSILHKIFYTYYRWPWLSLPLMTMQYVICHVYLTNGQRVLMKGRIACFAISWIIPVAALPLLTIEWCFFCVHRSRELQCFSVLIAWLPSNPCFFRSTQFSCQMASCSVQPFFAWLTLVPNSQMGRQHYILHLSQ